MRSARVLQAVALLLIFLALLQPLRSFGAKETDRGLRLELLQILFREGERAPRQDEGYPLGKQSGPWAQGQLTELGYQRMLRLGGELRRRYARFLGEVYQPENVYAYSADRDSCKASMQVLVESVYGLGELRNRPTVIVRSLPREIDVLMNSKACARYAKEINWIRHGADVQKKLSQYEGLYEYISQVTGLQIDSAKPDVALSRLYNLLEMQRSLNVSLPAWCTEGVYNLLSEMAYINYNLASYTSSLRRQNGGPLLLRFLESKLYADPAKKLARLHLYAGEAHNVAAFVRALNKYFPRVPKFGSAVIVEKLRDRAEREYVRIRVWTGVTERMITLQVGACGDVCPLHEYARFLEELLPTDREMRCLIEQAAKRTSYSKVIDY